MRNEVNIEFLRFHLPKSELLESVSIPCRQPVFLREMFIGKLVL